MALIKLSPEEKRKVRKQLVTWARSQSGRRIMTGEAHKLFYQILSEMGLPSSQIKPTGRAKKPRYSELGMTRVAGRPTKNDVIAYRKITDGGELGGDGFVTSVLLFDNNLITDRSAVMTYKGLADLYEKYLGRANDFNHEFDARQAGSRIIGLHLGTDPNYALHPDRPSETLNKLGGSNPFNGVYTALWADLAFPRIMGDNLIERVEKAAVKDVSIAFAASSDLCSVCLEPMSQSLCFSWCEEHGFPGGRTEDGQLVSTVMDGVSDAFTFGIVSDGAVPNAGIILDPEAAFEEEIQSQEPPAVPEHKDVYTGGVLNPVDSDGSISASVDENGELRIRWPQINSPFAQYNVSVTHSSKLGDVEDTLQFTIAK